MSFDIPEYTGDITAAGTMRLLEAIRETGSPSRASTRPRRSEMFGKVQEVPQTETTPFYPRSPYACAKVYAYWIDGELPRELRHARQQRHPLQPRIARAAARPSSRARSPAPSPRIKVGLQDKLYLGNLDAKRDWGYAKEYVEPCGSCSSRPRPTTT